jgi:hypothetical protein
MSAPLMIASQTVPRWWSCADRRRIVKLLPMPLAPTQYSAPWAEYCDGGDRFATPRVMPGIGQGEAAVGHGAYHRSLQFGGVVLRQKDAK